MATKKQIFAVDTNTGQVYIQGDLFVQSADSAGDSWIVGEMVSADSIIELAEGAIVLDGKQGRITVYDPANHSNGNFLRIENGFVRQYENFQVVRQLINIETGTVATDTWKTLSGYYKSQPDILISPDDLPTYSADFSNQNQRLSCFLGDVEKVSEGRYRFKGHAVLDGQKGTFPVPAATDSKITMSELNKEYALTDGNIEAFRSVESKTTVYKNVDSLTLSISATPLFEVIIDRGTNDCYFFIWLYGAINYKVRYRLVGTSAWSYSATQTITCSSTSIKTYTGALSMNFPSMGNYEVGVVFERVANTSAGDYYAYATGRHYVRSSATYSQRLTNYIVRSTGATLNLPTNANQYAITNATVTVAADRKLVSGSLSYTAIGD